MTLFIIGIIALAVWFCFESKRGTVDDVIEGDEAGDAED